MCMPMMIYGTRDPEYESQLARLKAAGKTDQLNILASAERQIISEEGFPKNSIGVYSALLEIDGGIWQTVVKILETAHPDHPIKRTLQLLQRQRIFFGSCVDIVYTVYQKFDLPFINFHVFTIHSNNNSRILKSPKSVFVEYMGQMNQSQTPPRQRMNQSSTPRQQQMG